MISATAFLGDGERTFALHRPQLVELERRTGAGIGALSDRIASKSYSFTDLVETIRLGLIGGGASPQEAAQLVETYVDPRPIAETLPIAYAILEARFFGSSVEHEAAEAIEEGKHGFARALDEPFEGLAPKDIRAAVEATQTAYADAINTAMNEGEAVEKDSVQ